MAEDIYINISPVETRVAVLEGGLVQEVLFERENNRGIVGNIYLGKIARILPGMQSAFVDIGLERNGILALPKVKEAASPGSPSAAPAPAPVLYQGQKILVQVTREPRDDKGPRLSRELSLSSRYLVLMPGPRQLGVSQQIRKRAERERLLQLLENALDDGAQGEPTAGRGFVLRTAAEGASQESIAADLQFLRGLWDSVQARTRELKKPQLVYAEPPLFSRVLRDRASPALERIVIDDASGFAALDEFCRRFQPALADRLEHYSHERPLFETSGIEGEIQQALNPRVELKSGAYLVIEQTEAMTTVDINTGSFVGKKSLEETAFETNQEAVPELARQLRLRNLGGIIVIDFIDMQRENYRQQVFQALETALRADSAIHSVAGLSPLGLAEIGRKRTGQSLQQALCEECPTCDGSGVIKSEQTS